MLKSIQWKLVIISFLLVWLAMSIVGGYITENIKKSQVESVLETITIQGEYLADLIKDKTVGAPNIQETVSSWFFGQGQHVKAVYVYENDSWVASQERYDASIKDSQNGLFVVNHAITLRQRQYWSDENNEYYKSIGIPIITSNNEVLGAIYIGADISGVQDSMKNIRDILTNATIWALCITALLGNFLAKTITGPIKEVTSKAERLAKGDFGQIITVKSQDEVGQLTEMFNYLTVRLKSTLDEMYSEKNKVETILTHMTDGIIAVNKSGQVIHANPAAYKIFNIKETDIYEKSFDEIAQSLNLGITIQELFNDSDSNFNILAINNLIIKLNVVLFRNEKNETAGAILVLQDVTEQERLDKMRKEFVANVSHELRTPLTTIKSYAETLLDGALDSRDIAVNFLNVINSESERMTRLVRDLLQLSKLDYDKMEWNMKEINLSQIIKECIFKMEISAKQKEQQLAYDITEEELKIIGDKDRIEQVMINILSNAIKYTPENGIISVMVAGAENDMIEIRIADTGIGIPVEDLPRLFERFYRVDKARSRMMGGTGLGLSIAKNIVEAHNGSIRIESEYGKGTVVIISLPRMRN